MEYFLDYLLFSAKLVTVIALLALPLLLAATLRRDRRAPAVPLRLTRLNDRLRDTALALDETLLPPKVYKQRVKAARKADKARAARSEEETAGRSFVCEFTGDLRASAVVELAEAVTGILAVARSGDEVIVALESAGGTIHGYGLAASQLSRIRRAGLRLRVVVDRIAASGGYMMACVADEIVAAPFAIIGSIGVVAQLPNFHRLLKKHDVDFEQITAGEFKRTLTLFGENTDADREKFQQDIDDAHALFKEFVAEYRPALDLERVATGEYWFATRALELGLVDAIKTSDDVIVEAAAERDVYRVTVERKSSMLKRLCRPLLERAGLLSG